MNVPSPSPNCHANLSGVNNENHAPQLLVNYAVFHASTTYTFKQGNIPHLVSRDLNARCHSAPPYYPCSAVSTAFMISESPASFMVSAEIMNGFLHTSAKSIEVPLYEITGI